MNREEAIRKLEYSKKAYQRLIDEKVDSGKLIGKDVRGEWKADTPLDKVYKSMIDALEIAIKALEQEPKTEAVKTAIIQELKDHFIEPEDAGLTIKGEYWLAREVLAIIEETEPKAKMVEPQIESEVDG